MVRVVRLTAGHERQQKTLIGRYRRFANSADLQGSKARTAERTKYPFEFGHRRRTATRPERYSKSMPHGVNNLLSKPLQIRYH